MAVNSLLVFFLASPTPWALTTLGLTPSPVPALTLALLPSPTTRERGCRRGSWRRRPRPGQPPGAARGDRCRPLTGNGSNLPQFDPFLTGQQFARPVQ